MDPVVPVALEKGAEALGEELGVFGKRVEPGTTSFGTTAATRASVGSSLSSATISGQRVEETTAIAQSEEATNVRQFLEDEICENIYQSCLARVAEMSRNRSISAGAHAEESAQEAREWEAAKDMATEEKEDFKGILEEAKKETQTAAKKLDSADAILHGKAYADSNSVIWQEKNQDFLACD